jgi:general secretion pathway protein M
MLKKLSKRQKYGVYAAVGVLCLFTFLQFILFPVLDNRERLRRSLQVKTKTLADMQQLRAEYLLTTQRSDDLKKRFARRTKGFTLFSFLDKLARDAGVKDSITYMKPSNTVQKNTGTKISTIEMKLQSVALPKLTDYLYRVETSENMVSIKRASFIKKEKEKGSLDVILQVETFDI